MGASSPGSPSPPSPAAITLSRTIARAPRLKIIAIDDLPSRAEASAATARTPKITDVASFSATTASSPPRTRTGIPSGGAMTVDAFGPANDPPYDHSSPPSQRRLPQRSTPEGSVISSANAPPQAYTRRVGASPSPRPLAASPIACCIVFTGALFVPGLSSSPCSLTNTPHSSSAGAVAGSPSQGDFGRERQTRSS
ncbi:hypothetical protein [Sorangium cellulosum]|uniref:hypothetical protein n=1 Tax=Sorangium cellulosum TaxID=56 RepID=UPI0016512FF8|nr:hypothetical protein [Sorangium cellulosum]